jgi:hypothetical protein
MPCWLTPLKETVSTGRLLQWLGEHLSFHPWTANITMYDGQQHSGGLTYHQQLQLPSTANAAVGA